jgi:hypothetical protein
VHARDDWQRAASEATSDGARMPNPERDTGTRAAVLIAAAQGVPVRPARVSVTGRSTGLSGAALNADDFRDRLPGTGAGSVARPARPHRRAALRAPRPRRRRLAVDPGPATGGGGGALVAAALEAGRDAIRGRAPRRGDEERQAAAPDETPVIPFTRPNGPRPVPGRGTERQAARARRARNRRAANDDADGSPRSARPMLGRQPPRQRDRLCVELGLDELILASVLAQ